MVDEVGFTSAGRAAREAVEEHTDVQMAGMVAALGDHMSELVDILTPWGQAVRDGHGYPASGPHDLADLATRG